MARLEAGQPQGRGPRSSCVKGGHMSVQRKDGRRVSGRVIQVQRVLAHPLAVSRCLLVWNEKQTGAGLMCPLRSGCRLRWESIAVRAVESYNHAHEYGRGETKRGVPHGVVNSDDNRQLGGILDLRAVRRADSIPPAKSTSVDNTYAGDYRRCQRCLRGRALSMEKVGFLGIPWNKHLYRRHQPAHRHRHRGDNFWTARLCDSLRPMVGRGEKELEAIGVTDAMSCLINLHYKIPGTGHSSTSGGAKTAL